MTRFAVAAALGAALLAGDPAESRSAQHKLDLIESGQVSPGSSVLFTNREMTSWISDQAMAIAPDAVAGLHLELGAGRVTGSATIDFSRLREAPTGDESNGIGRWFGQNVLAGPRPVSVTARVESRGGQARVELERVVISGVPLEGPGLDLLIRLFLTTEFPDAKVDQWFALAPGIDRIAVTPRGVAVYIGAS